MRIYESHGEAQVALRAIVEQCFPDELQLFDATSEWYIKKALNGYSEPSAASSIPHFRFVEEAKSVLQFVLVIQSTLEAVRSMWNSFGGGKQSQRDVELAAQTWHQEMVKAGLSKEKADEVVLKCMPQLQKLLDEC